MEYVPHHTGFGSSSTSFLLSHNADAFLTSLRDNTTGNAEAIGPQDAIENMSMHNDQTFPMLLRFLKETKKESYFTGLQDNNPTTHGSCESKM